MGEKSVSQRDTAQEHHTPAEDNFTSLPRKNASIVNLMLTRLRKRGDPVQDHCSRMLCDFAQDSFCLHLLMLPFLAGVQRKSQDMQIVSSTFDPVCIQVWQVGAERGPESANLT